LETAGYYADLQHMQEYNFADLYTVDRKPVEGDRVSDYNKERENY